MPCYQELLTQPIIPLAEKKEEYNFFTERHLQAIWLDQKYFKDLITADGEPIQILSPGIWNGEAGPDFLRAHLRIGEKEYRGDIELHLSAEDWYHHQHHIDPRYNDTVFHISLWKPRNPKSIVTQKGTKIVSGYLEDRLTISLARIVQLVDLDLYPYRKFIGSGRCAQALYKVLSEEKIIELFFSAALWRLEQKNRYLKLKQPDPDDQLLLGIAMTLGYKNNPEPFMELYLALKDNAKASEEVLVAICMGITGFFKENYVKKWNDSPRYQQLKSLWEASPHKHEEIGLKLNQVRPLNHPIRRFIYLAKMAKDPNSKNLYHKMESHWIKNSTAFISKGKWGKLRAEIKELIPAYKDEYWNAHFLFENGVREGFIPLIGEELKEEILVNVFFPILYHAIKGRGSEKEMEAFHQFYSSFPGMKNSKVKYLSHRFFGNSNKSNLLNKANLEQGAFQLHRDFCIHYEASCEGCPFVERYLQVFFRST